MQIQILVLAADGYGAGKTTVAEYLMKKGFIATQFMTPMRAMLRGLLQSLCWDDDEIEDWLTGSKKNAELPPPFPAGCTMRHLQQTLGTEWGRHQVGDLFWVDALIHRVGMVTEDIQKLERDGSPERLKLVVDSARRPEEVTRLRAAFGEDAVELLKICGRGQQNGHQIEIPFGGLGEIVVMNDGSVEDLYRQIDTVLDLRIPHFK